MQRRHFLTGSAALACFPRHLYAQDRKIDTLYINGQVWTGQPGAPLVSRFGVSGNRIAAIGQQHTESLRGAATRIIDLDGAFVTPGLIDTHTHFLMGSSTLSQVNLRDATDQAAFVSRMAAFAAQTPAGKWIEGGNWDEQMWGGTLPTRHWIDDVTRDNPVAVSRLDQHMLLANTRALKLAGIDGNTPDPEGGVIVRDNQGKPTGIFKDNAMALIFNVIPAASKQELASIVKQGIEHSLSKGVTQAHVKALDWQCHDTLMSLRQTGEPGMRFYSFLPIKDFKRVNALVEQHGRGDDWLRWGGLKGMLDGSLGSGTALFHQPYTDAPDNAGITVTNPEQMLEWALQADSLGLQLAIHAIGDRANDLVLDMYSTIGKRNGAKDRRGMIEHAQHLRPEAIERFAQLGVIPAVQPYHAIDDGRWLEKRIGKSRLAGTYAFASLFDANATVSFGSDWPVAPIDPLLAIEAAVLRQTIDGANPEGWTAYEMVSVEQSLKAYTVNNAYAGFQEDRLGRLLPGYLADFVVFEKNLMTVAPDTINQTRILQTTVNGQPRFGGI